MARVATIIDKIIDAWGDRWDVREYRDAPYGPLAIGWPAGQRGKGYGGPRVIITPALRTYLEKHQERGGLKLLEDRLPISRGAIKRLRSLLNHDCSLAQAAWWLDRTDDLLSLTGPEFARRHDVSASAASLARTSLFGISRQRPDGWWREDHNRLLLLSDNANALIADALGISVGAVGRLRGVLLRLDGYTSQQIEVLTRKRLSAARIGKPAHPNTRQALLQGARRKKSFAHRKKISQSLKHRRKKPVNRRSARKVSDQDVIDARKLYAARNVTRKELSQMLEISVGAVTAILDGRSYAEIGGPIHKPKSRTLSDRDICEATD